MKTYFNLHENKHLDDIFEVQVVVFTQKLKTVSKAICQGTIFIFHGIFNFFLNQFAMKRLFLIFVFFGNTLPRGQLQVFISTKNMSKSPIHL